MYDAQGGTERRDRWVKIVTAWVRGADDEMTELLGELPLIELVDLDATLPALRHEIHRVAAEAEPPT